MKKVIAAFAIGLTFGLGLVVSQMIDPKKVLGFLDVTGGWDPSLAFVMGGALFVTYIGYRLVWKMPRPFVAEAFDVPSKRNIDTKLIVGAILFGVGWGLVGFCPGPAIAALSLGGTKAIVFVVAMSAGMVLARKVPEFRT